MREARALERLARRSHRVSGDIRGVAVVVEDEKSKRGTDAARIAALEAEVAALGIRVAELERVRG